METNTPISNHEPDRKDRSHWFLIAVIVLLGLVTIAQGFALLKTQDGWAGWPAGRILREQWRKLCPGHAADPRQASAVSPGRETICWESQDDLEQIHAQIDRLLRNMSLPFNDTMPGGLLSGMAGRHGKRNWPATVPPGGYDLIRLQREIERIFETAFSESQPAGLLSRVNHGWELVPSTAAMNIEDRGSNYVVTVAMPGFDKQGIKIALEGRLLIIDALQSSPAPAPAADRAGLRHGRFHTQIMLPDNIEGAGAQAAYERSLLRVCIPKASQTNSLARFIAIR